MAINNFIPGQVLDVTSLNQLVSGYNTLEAGMTKARRGARQTVQNHVSSASSYGSGSEIAVLTTSIVTEETNSQILYNLNLSYECHHDSTIVLQRKINAGAWTTIGSGNAYGSSRTGFMYNNYDTNNDSTSVSNSKSYLDSPGVAAGATISYRIYSSGQSVYINRTINSTATAAYERASSSIQLTEMVI